MTSSRSDRKDPRYRVHLSVRFARAMEFVTEYAENLSQGGLFVAGAHDLGPLSEVDLEIDLPGSGVYRVKAEVAHVIDQETALQFGRKAGAGLAITSRPDGFDDALSSYLLRLGRRADVMVLVDDDGIGVLLAAAGFQVRAIASPDEVLATVARAPVSVLALVVGSRAHAAYERAAAEAGATDLVIAIDSPAQFDDLLSRLDDEL